MTKKQHLYGIDIVRFISAAMVAIFHIGYSSWITPKSAGRIYLEQQTYSMPDWTSSIFWSGWVGVNIFFVISGFVIALSAHGADAIQFAKRRMGRLYPAAWICATLTALCLGLNGIYVDLLGKYLRSIFLKPLGPWVDAQYWTLGVEIIFYAIVFVMLLAKSPKLLPVIAAALGIGSATFLIAASADARLLPYLEGPWRLTLLPYGVYFALGMIIWLWSANRLNKSLLFVGGISLVGAILEMRLHSIDMGTTLGLSKIDPYSAFLLPVSIFLIMLIIIILSVTWTKKLGKVASWWTRALGLATYPLYLLHFGIGVTLVREMVSLGVPALLALLATLFALTAVSMIIALRLEQPLRKAFERIFDVAITLVRRSEQPRVRAG